MYSTPDQGYSTPLGYSPNFVVNQKFDTIVSEFVEQKKILMEARKENAQLSEGLSHLMTEVSKLQLTDSGASGVKVKKKIPLDLSVSHVFSSKELYRYNVYNS